MERVRLLLNGAQSNHNSARGVDWNELRRLVQDPRLGMATTALQCYATVLQEPDVPMDIFETVMDKLVRYELSRELRQDCLKCWSCALGHALRSIEMNATATHQLLAIRSWEDLQSNLDLRHWHVAIQKTIRLLQVSQRNDHKNQQKCRQDNYLHILVRDSYPSFLILLLGRLMPHLLQERNALGELPLHVACQIIKKDTRHIARIRVAEPCPDDDDDNDNDDNWPSLLNRSSPIQLLCHLYPGAGSQASNATGNPTNQCRTTYTIQRGPIPVEITLSDFLVPSYS